MNPINLFTLTAEQRQRYLIQPDNFPGFTGEEISEEYELPPYIAKSVLRFWYNNQYADFSTHWHNAQEMIIPLEEGYTVTVQNTSYHLEPGDIFVIPSGELHSLQAPHTGARFIFLYELDLFSQLSDFSRTRSFLSKPIHITMETCPSIYEKEISLIMQTAAHYWSNSSVMQMHVYSGLMEFYACYIDYCSNYVQEFPRKTSATQRYQTQKLNNILKYMEQHYSEKITLESITQIFHLSKFYFTRVFKQFTGQTFTDYLNMIRIQESEKLLLNTAFPISRISASCGYVNVSSFNRNFHKLKGCTPLEFRNYYGHGQSDNHTR